MSDDEERYVKKPTLLHGINNLNWSSDTITRNILLGKDFQT